ncbi:MAG: hypothetical protein OXI77_07770 [Chloroflexota bacterium]|nr:hypothetical protein [Chloroflexota bacterium]MDE2908337.1 hypothetical protein [Chloroflexota bacterium]
MSQLIIEPESWLYHQFSQLIEDADLVFFAGLPGVGKSLLLQQLTLMARAAGRRVTLLQWDVARQPFETPRYPLSEGATHPLVINATGLWLRAALADWDARAKKPGDMLIGEAPFIGGRCMEIARSMADEAEALLSNERTQFLIPVPSRPIRALIEDRRARSIAAPQHENETHDAPPDLLRALWLDVYRVGVALGLAEEAAGESAYSPAVYEAVYRQLLRHRHARVLPVNEPLQPTASVYDQMTTLPYLQATRAQAQALLRKLEAVKTPAQAIADMERWYKV